MQCLAGLRKPSAGDIKWQKNDHHISIETLKKNLGYAAPYISLYSELTCAENLDFLLKLRDIGNRKQRIEGALEKTGIASQSDKLFGKLSTGQQQRLRLASALSHNPAILFLDEPGSNLDEKGREVIKKTVEDFKRAGKIVFIASNSRDELALCDRLYSVEEEKLID